MFSLYHLGYLSFRTLGDILLIYALEFGFAIVDKFSDGIVLYFVNLLNAFVT